MQNLEQIRARNAWEAATNGKNYAGPQDGDVIKKIPPHIMNYGLLATAAFAFSGKEGWKNAFEAIAKHLSDPQIDLIDKRCSDVESMVQFLTRPEASSAELKLATNETMAWLNYARRFIKKDSN